MKKTKRNAVLVIIAFLLVLGIAIYTAIFGVADRGKVEYIKLGLDLKGGLSVTYEIQEDDYSDKDLEDTKYKIEKRVEAYTPTFSPSPYSSLLCHCTSCNHATKRLALLAVIAAIHAVLRPARFTQGYDARNARADNCDALPARSKLEVRAFKRVAPVAVEPREHHGAEE